MAHADVRGGPGRCCRLLLMLRIASAVVTVALVPTRSSADFLSSTTQIDRIISIDGDGIGFIEPEGYVSSSHATLRKTFQAVAPIDVTFRVNDHGGVPSVFLIFDSYLYNFSFEKWAGFRHQLGYKDADGHFHASNEQDGLSFANDGIHSDMFISPEFTRHEFGPGHDTLDWSGDTIQFPQRTIFLLAIWIPPSNAAMPSFALRDGGYEFTLRELPIVSWDPPPDPVIVPEPPASLSFGIGLLSLAMVALARRGWLRSESGDVHLNATTEFVTE